ncbi:hypothetical protein Ga0466249_004103 [Sporomusaceae bacterium BoRhaA]|nr:hypothetical protein [Pelorhabdus rhamnosifermentans]
MEGRRQADVIARAGWPGESHPLPGIPTVYYPVKDKSFYDIPLRALKV